MEPPRSLPATLKACLEQYRPWRLTVAHSESRNGRIQRSGQLGYGCSGRPSAASPVQDFEEPFASSARYFALKYLSRAFSTDNSIMILRRSEAMGRDYDIVIHRPD